MKIGLLNKDDSHEDNLDDNKERDHVQEKTNSSFLPPINDGVNKSLDFKANNTTRYNS